MTPLVVSGGLLTVDLVHEIDALPGPNQKIVGTGQRLEVGGPAANAARTVAALGLRSLLVAPFGTSPLTGFVRDVLDADGVEWLDPAAHQPNPSPVSSVLVTRGTGQRAVVSGGGGPAPEDWDPATVVDSAAAVLVDGHGGRLPRGLTSGGRARGIPVLLDGGSHKPGMEAYLPDVDLALLSADFAPPHGGDPVAWTAGAGAGAVARSAGAGAIRLLVSGNQIEIPVPAVTAADTNGAGDVLHGAAAAALALVGRDSRGYAAVLDFAGRVASASVQYPGALGWATDPATLSAARAALRALSPGPPKATP